MEAMEPTREINATLVDLLDRVLDKGLVINADIIISLAGIPLIGVNLRAAIAGMETMLQYGMMKEFDEMQRAVAREEMKLHLADGEEIAQKIFALQFQREGIFNVWRGGHLYVTNKKIFFEDGMNEILFQADLEMIRGIAARKARHLDREREEIYIMLKTGKIIKLRARSSIKEVIEKKALEKGNAIEEEVEFLDFSKIDKEFNEIAPFIEADEEISYSGKIWYKAAEGILEAWRPGHLCMTNKKIYWFYDFEQKVMLKIPLHELKEVKILEDELLLFSKNGEAHFSKEKETIEEWKRAIGSKIKEKSMIV